MLAGVQDKQITLSKKTLRSSELGAALHDIHDAAISAQEESLRATIDPLQKDMNFFYSKLTPIPHFDKI